MGKIVLSSLVLCYISLFANATTNGQVTISTDTISDNNTSTSSAGLNILDGWQLLGATSDLDLSIFDGSCVDFIWGYKNGAWQLHIANGQEYAIPSNVTMDLSLNQGDGFWVKATGVCDINTTISFLGKAYGAVTSPYTGKVWLDRNLGASKVCTALDDTACYGDYYQWGRDYDGHQVSTSSISTTQVSDIESPGSDFITGVSNTDWTSQDGIGSQRSANWDIADGSSICPVGYKIPTKTELANETIDANGSVANNIDAFNNFLKLPSAGYRHYINGSVYNQGLEGSLWSQSVDGTYSSDLRFKSDSASMNLNLRSNGLQIRCIKE